MPCRNCSARLERFSLPRLLRHAFNGSLGWPARWWTAEPQPSCDAMTVVGGGRGLATACCLESLASQAPDRSPIIGRTPVAVLFVNRGWGTGGFKATPGSGHVFAHSIATGARHPINAGFTLDRFRTGRLLDDALAAAVAL